MEPISAILAIVSAIGGAISSAMGGWDIILQGLLTVMALDVATGVAVATWMHNSPKTSSGGFSARVLTKGVVQKFLILAVLFIAVVIDTVMGIEILRDVVCMFYILEESMSVIENARRMGVPVPGKLVQVLDVLESEFEDEAEDDESEDSSSRGLLRRRKQEETGKMN